MFVFFGGIDGIDGWANAVRVPFFLPGNLGECRRERKRMPLDATWRKSAAEAESEDVEIATKRNQKLCQLCGYVHVIRCPSMSSVF